MYRKARGEATVFDRAFWSGEPLDELFEKIGSDPQGQSEKIFAAGMLEWRRSHKQDGGLIAGAQARIDRAMNVAIARESEDLNKGLSFLATTGFDRALHRAVRHGLGDQAQLRADRDQPEHQPCGRGPRHCRGAAGHRRGPDRGHPGGGVLQQAELGLANGSSAAMKALPTNSRRSCRASWTAEPWAAGSSNRAGAEAGGADVARAGLRR